MSDNSDTEHDLGKVRATRKRAKGFVIKKNMKGETQLHTACINGKVEVVRHLLDQGHPVNIRDNCGWLPLHEAAIYGYVEIVKMLLNKGAAINDRGGTGCNGKNLFNSLKYFSHCRKFHRYNPTSRCSIQRSFRGD